MILDIPSHHFLFFHKTKNVKEEAKVPEAVRSHFARSFSVSVENHAVINCDRLQHFSAVRTSSVVFVFGWLRGTGHWDWAWYLGGELFLFAFFHISFSLFVRRFWCGGRSPVLAVAAGSFCLVVVVRSIQPAYSDGKSADQ